MSCGAKESTYNPAKGGRTCWKYSGSCAALPCLWKAAAPAHPQPCPRRRAGM